VASETAHHRDLKRLALVWAREQRYAIPACEVSLPHLRFRLDVGACRPAFRLDRGSSGRATRSPVIGATALFECKQARADFLNDSRRSDVLTQRLKLMHARKERHETRLRLQYPSLRNGDALFAEYETHDFERSGDELYLKVLAQLRAAARQLYEHTKFEKLCRWKAANLHYVVTEPRLLRPHELPDGWGLLVRNGETLDLVVKPVWHEVPDSARLLFLQQIARAATAAVHREFGINRPDEENGWMARLSSIAAL